MFKTIHLYKQLVECLFSFIMTAANSGTSALSVGYRAAPCVYDWDGDGLNDLLCGNGDGYVFLRIVREAPTSVDAPAFATAIPGNTPTEYYCPLAQIKWDYTNGIVNDIAQLQYGNIVIDRTTQNYCP